MVPDYPATEGIGVEEAARILRYECYQKAAEELKQSGAGRVSIALAHHANDIQIGAIRPVLLPTLFQILLDLSPRHTKKRTHNQNVISQHPFRVHTAHPSSYSA